MSGPDTEEHINQVYKNQNFQAIGLDYWSGSNSGNVGTFKTSTGITYPLCRNASATRGLYQAYEGLDVSMVIDHSGIVRYKGSGVKTAELTAMINNLIGATPISAPESVPQQPSLQQNYPNPFNPSTIISFDLDRGEKVSLKIYDNQGRLVRVLLDNALHAGRHSLYWDGRNKNGLAVSGGNYFYILKAGNFSQTNKMTLLR